MTGLLSTIFLIAGAALCLLASVGILRLPDFFMRMHAATKAGVAGAGLVLIGVAFAEPSATMWFKVVLAIAFLLVTTPVAGHLLARAGYMAGVPLWNATREDQLEGELRRGQFDRPAQAAVRSGPRPGRPDITRIVLALVNGSHAPHAIAHAIALAATHRVPLVGLAIVDTKILNNVGSVPLGANHHAARLRSGRIEKARHSLADLVQLFEQAAGHAGVSASVIMEEGDPVTILAAQQESGTLLLMGRSGWFDHGVADGRNDPLAYLVRRGVFPIVSVAQCPSKVRTITFIHDGSARSDGALRWLLDSDPWPAAELHLVPDVATPSSALAAARSLAASRPRLVTAKDHSAATIGIPSQVVVFGNERQTRWMTRAGARPRYDDVPIVVFG